jgi:N-acyl-L-homoserine lactone synthetase
MAIEAAGFCEDAHRVTWRPNRSELEQAHRLRADVFCRELGWVGSWLDPTEHDEFDGRATHVVVADRACEIVATVRLIPGDATWMLDGVFRDLVAGRAILRRTDAMEASRLAVAKRARSARARLSNGKRVADLVYKAAYVLCSLRRVRYLYMVTSETVLRHMSSAGLPCVPIASPTMMPDGVSAVPIVLDWERLGPDEAVRAWYREGLTALYSETISGEHEAGAAPARWDDRRGRSPTAKIGGESA